MAQFASDRKAQVEAAAREVADALDDAADDLRFAGELLSRPGSVAEHRRELLALLEVVGQYKAIVVLDSEGQQRFNIMDRRAGPAVTRGAVGTVLTEAACEAFARPPGDILTSPPVAAAPGGWFRVFATAYSPSEDGPGGSVAVLVDTEPSFAALKLISRQPEAKLLLIGAHGVPTPASDPALIDWHKRLEAEAASIPAYTELVEHMRAGERGTVPIPENEAALLGPAASPPSTRPCASGCLPPPWGPRSPRPSSMRPPPWWTGSPRWWRPPARPSASSASMASCSTLPVLIMTAFGGVENAVEAMRRGATHYFTKPFRLDEVLLYVQRAIAERRLREENRALRQAVGDRSAYGALVGRSAPMRTLYELIERVAHSHAPVLVRGESGTGKELVARALHFEGPRKDGPFVAVNCTAIPNALLESELFGHVAYRRERGHVEGEGWSAGAEEDRRGQPRTCRGQAQVLQNRAHPSRFLHVRQHLPPASTPHAGQHLHREGPS